MNRDHHCRGCRRRSRQRLCAAERPGVEQWRCVTCGMTFLTYRTDLGAVEDAEGLCIVVVNEKLSGVTRDKPRNGYAPSLDRPVWAVGLTRVDARLEDRLDLEDALGYLREQLFVAWRDFDPSRCVAFRSYAVTALRRRLIDWIRKQRSKDGRKPQANAVALSDLPANGAGFDAGDETRLEHALADGALDNPAHSLADLRRVLVERRDQLAGLDPLQRERGRSEAASG